MFSKGEQLPLGTVPTLAPNPEGDQEPVDKAGAEAAPDVTPEPPKHAEPVEPKPDEPQPQAKAEPKPEKRNPMSKTKPKQAQKPKSPNHSEMIASRARRMFKSEMRKIAQAMGLESYDEETFNQKIEEMAKAREENLSSSERLESRLKQLDEERTNLRAEKARLQDELTKVQRELTGERRKFESFQVEQEIRDFARAAGIRDTDYGVELFKRHVKRLPEDQEPDANDFFESLKKDESKRYLFHETPVSAGPKPVGQQSNNNQAQAEGETQGHIPPQGAPQATPPGKPDGQVPNALEMDKQQFNQHVKDRYQYRPGMA